MRILLKNILFIEEHSNEGHINFVNLEMCKFITKIEQKMPVVSKFPRI